MSGVSLLSPYANFYAKQSRKGCLQTLLGCDAKTEIHIATLEDPYHDVFYALEDSHWCWRFFCQAVHPFEMNLSQGADAGGPSVAHYERPLRCPVQNCKCCCYQEIYVNDPATGRRVGSITEGFYWCIPTFHVKDAQENVTHHIHVPVCFGCCANICAEGCCRIPFYIYPANDYRYDNFDGKIVKMWGSLFTELIGVHQFQCQFPQAATADQKAVFMGGTFLLNELFFKAGAHSN